MVDSKESLEQGSEAESSGVEAHLAASEAHALVLAQDCEGIEDPVDQLAFDQPQAADLEVEILEHLVTQCLAEALVLTLGGYQIGRSGELPAYAGVVSQLVIEQTQELPQLPWGWVRPSLQESAHCEVEQWDEAVIGTEVAKYAWTAVLHRAYVHPPPSLPHVAPEAVMAVDSHIYA